MTEMQFAGRRVGKPDMNAELAAKRLDENLRKHSWYVSAGVGTVEDGEAIFVYVRSTRHRELSALVAGWHGIPVVIRASGRARAVARRFGTSAATSRSKMAK